MTQKDFGGERDDDESGQGKVCAVKGQKAHRRGIIKVTNLLR